MAVNAPTLLGLLTLSVAFIVFRAAFDVARQISPQGCRMSWMSPSYVLQPEFNTSWTPLASRYSLWLYREAGWEPDQPIGLPVLFIPGNAGSSHQVRSIASSAARQYFSSPFVVSPEFAGRRSRIMDFYAVEFNEDLSAFHGSTLESQIAYTSAAVKYILSRYPPNTRIIVMGHSMGGVVGTALLPSENITTLITMSTSHTLPPARFDARVEEIYDRNRKVLREVDIPIVSICGGTTDMMIPSESCMLPGDRRVVGVYRRTVFTSALEGAWTGVGHREMVWCHQVRWRVARTVLELGIAKTAEERVQVLDRWLRDGNLLPLDGSSVRELNLGEGEYEVLPADLQLVLNRPLGKRTYLVPIPSAQDEQNGRTFVLYVSQGSVSNMSPHRVLNLGVAVHVCGEPSADATMSCNPLLPASLKLLPTLVPGKPFPVPDEGADESEGIAFFETELSDGAGGWVGVTVDAGDDGVGWVTGGFDQTHHVRSEFGLWDLLFGGRKISLPQSEIAGSRTEISLPRLPATALLVYRLVPKTVEHPSCTAPLFPPLLVHTSQGSEIHYHRLASEQRIFLHTHSSGPYVPPLRPSHGLNLTIHSSGPGCQDIAEVHLSIDWWTSLGRTGARYPTTLLGWSVGIVSLLLFYSWHLDGQQLSVGESLGVFVKRRMLMLMAAAGVVALLPLGPDYFLGVGNGLGVLRAALAALLVGVATGVVCVSWWLIVVLMWPLRLLKRRSIQRKSDGVRRSMVIFMVLVLALILLFAPWQVAFLGCWVTQLLNCNATARSKAYPGSVPTLASSPTERTPTLERDGKTLETDSSADRSSPPLNTSNHTLEPVFANAHNQNAHMLLLLTWLLPLTMPVLAVWVRTMQTAGYATPFDGDHGVFNIVPALGLVGLLGRGRPLATTSAWRIPMQWGWLVVALVAFLGGGRRAYVVYEVASVQMAILVVCQIGTWVYG